MNTISIFLLIFVFVVAILGISVMVAARRSPGEAERGRPNVRAESDANPARTAIPTIARRAKRRQRKRR